MSDDIIDKAIAQIADHETTAARHLGEAARLKTWVNQYDQLAGREPRFGDVDAAPTLPPTATAVPTSPTTKNGWKAGTFLGKPFATAAKIILQERADAAGAPTPATVREIREALAQGSYDFGTSNVETQEHGIRIALGKNSAVFVRLPNSDLFGLCEWYPGIKRTVRPRIRLTEDQPSSSGEADDGEAAEGSAAPEAA